jgi:hypothetical protein
VIGVLLNNQHGQPILPVERTDRVKNLPRD